MNTVITLGSWQAIMAVSALRAMHGGDYAPFRVIFVTRVNEASMLSACSKYFRSLGAEVEPVSFSDLRSGYLKGAGIFPLTDAGRVFMPLQELFLNLEYMPEMSPSKRVYYEDGLHSLGAWNALESSQPSHSRRIKSKRLLRRLLLGKTRFTRQIRDSSEFHSYWGVTPPSIERCRDFSKITRDILRAEIKAFYQANVTEPKKKLEGGRVILGSNFAMYGMLSADNEYGPIFDYIESCPAGERIYWKPHPRASYLYTDYLLKRYSNVNLWPVEDLAVPFECLLTEQSQLRVASIMSTSLVYAKLLHGLDVDLIGDIGAELSETGSMLLPSYNFLKEFLSDTP